MHPETVTVTFLRTDYCVREHHEHNNRFKTIQVFACLLSFLPLFMNARLTPAELRLDYKPNTVAEEVAQAARLKEKGT
jgi:hypothetical protein